MSCKLPFLLLCPLGGYELSKIGMIRIPLPFSLLSNMSLSAVSKPHLLKDSVVYLFIWVPWWKKVGGRETGRWKENWKDQEEKRSERQRHRSRSHLVIS